MVIAFYFFIRWFEDDRRLWLVLSFAALGLGFLAKSPLYSVMGFMIMAAFLASGPAQAQGPTGSQGLRQTFSVETSSHEAVTQENEDFSNFLLMQTIRANTAG